VLLVFPVILCASTNTFGRRQEDAEVNGSDSLLFVQSEVLVLSLGCLWVASCMWTPFIDPANNFLECFSFLCTFITAIVGFVAVLVQSDTVFSLILNLFTAFSLVLMIVALLSELPVLRIFIKNFTQHLQLTKSPSNSRIPLVFSKDLSAR